MTITVFYFKDRGCGKLFVVDGLWKLSYVHCMMEMSTPRSQELAVYIPNLCPEVCSLI